jgi:Zn-dependent protease
MIPALLVGFTVHELAHSLVAFLLGDTSQVELKRLTWNPIRHISWLGTVTFLLLGFGWAKPVWVDYARLRIKNRPFGMFLVSIAGAVANVLTAILVLLGISLSLSLVWFISGASLQSIVEVFVTQEPGLDLRGIVFAFSTYMVLVNLTLAVFNLLPLPGLDGFQALMSLYAVIRNALKGTQEDMTVLPRLSRNQEVPERASTLSPAEIHFEIGLDYHREGQLDEAIARYRQAIAHDEHFSLAYYNQGLAYWAKSRPSLAANAFRAAVQSGSDLYVRAQAGARLQELGQFEGEAEADLGPPPLPLDAGSEGESLAQGPPSLDPEVRRQTWLHLGLGAAGVLLLALAAWIFVTMVTLMLVS